MRPDRQKRERLIQALRRKEADLQAKIFASNNPTEIEELAEKLYRITESRREEEYGLSLLPPT